MSVFGPAVLRHESFLDAYIHGAIAMEHVATRFGKAIRLSTTTNACNASLPLAQSLRNLIGSRGIASCRTSGQSGGYEPSRGICGIPPVSLPTPPVALLCW
jgi:hypothetical protein